MRLRPSADALLVVCVTIWGFNFTVIKHALGHGFSPLAFGSMRFTIATVAFTGVIFARGDVCASSGATCWRCSPGRPPSP